MAMIDALMMAYTVEMISIEKVVASVKRFSTFSASKELPYDLEDAMIFWINKVQRRLLGAECKGRLRFSKPSPCVCLGGQAGCRWITCLLCFSSHFLNSTFKTGSGEERIGIS